MGERLRVLFVEDSSDDAELEARELRSAGFDVVYDRVYSAADLKEAIHGSYEVVIADYNMPNFTGLEALAIGHELRPGIPFILVSGTLGEDRAVAALKAGAHDYVMKDNVRRLGPAVVRALRDTAAKRARDRADENQRALAQASATLGESLDYRLTVARVAEQTVSAYADWCVVDVGDDAGELRSVAVAHARGAVHPRVARVVNAQTGEARLGPAHVVRKGTAQLVPVVSDEVVDLLTDNAESRAVLLAQGVASFIGVPLRAHGSVIGALTLVRSDAGRPFDETDLVFAEELAQRMAFAIDNARLFARAQQAVRLRDDFLSVASHELRTPLTTLQLQLQSLASTMDKKQIDVTDPRNRAKLQRAVRSTQRLATLVDSLVDVSQLGGGKWTLTRVPMDLAEAVRAVVEREHEEAQRLGCELVVRVEEGVRGIWDRQRVEQMATNLLSNALKYGVGKPIDIAVFARDNWAVLTVRDRGMGIAGEDLERIFGRFERAVSVRNYGGLGLGLFVTRRIAEEHGGTITVESQPGEGALFSIRLPLDAGAVPGA